MATIPTGLKCHPWPSQEARLAAALRSDQEKLGLAQNEKESWQGIRDSDLTQINKKCTNQLYRWYTDILIKYNEILI